MYLGSLSSLDSGQRESLIVRMNQLLVGQYHILKVDASVEELAIKYVGQLKSEELGKTARGEKVVVSGGLINSSMPERIDLSTFRPLTGREGGGAWLCHQIIEQLGIPTFLRAQGTRSTKEIEWMLLNLQGRLLNPVSERATALWVEEVSGSKNLMSEVQKVHGEGLRQSALHWREAGEELEDYLYNRIDNLLDFKGQRFLYDLTNTYFEGRMLGSSLAQYGRSKERRSDAPIVSIGLLTNEQGFIRRSHFHAGNVSEPGTLEAVYKFLENSPGIVTDAGIGTTANIEQMASRNIPYICVVRQGFKSYNINFEEGEYFKHQTSNGQQYGLWLQSREHTFEVEGITYTDWLIFVKSEAKQAKEDSMIQKQKLRFETGLQAIRNSLDKPRGHKTIVQVHQRLGRLKEKNSRVGKAFQIKTADNGQNITHLNWTYDPEAEQRNGTYIIRRSEPVTNLLQGWKDYCALTQIEAVNRCCKTDLNMRPVYHQQDNTIQAHLFLTLIACTIVQFIRHQLAKADITASWKEIVRIMDTQKVVSSEFENDQNECFLLSNWSKPEPKTKVIYDALQLKYQPHNGFFFKIKKPDK